MRSALEVLVISYQLFGSPLTQLTIVTFFFTNFDFILLLSQIVRETKRHFQMSYLNERSFAMIWDTMVHAQTLQLMSVIHQFFPGLPLHLLWLLAHCVTTQELDNPQSLFTEVQNLFLKIACRPC